MNDCVWYFASACEGHGCRDCKDYISINCELGEQMLKAYWRDVDAALEPVREKWASKKGANDAD